MVLEDFSLPRGFSSSVEGLLASGCESIIIVKQNGHAMYGSAEPRRFKVLSGLEKTFPHEGFGQVTIFFPLHLTDDKPVPSTDCVAAL